MHPPRTTRRGFIAGAAALATTGVCGCAVPADSDAPPDGRIARDDGLLPAPRAAGNPIEVEPGLAIHPRADWGADLPARGPMRREDVRFLLVHHTESSNLIADPVDVIRAVYAFHTGAEKRWNDVAYNYFVAPDGSVWEGRAGSLAGPVVVDATGGNQGFAQLVCLLGDYSSVAPTAAAQQSMVRLLAHLAVRYGLSTWTGATVTFTSRGSNRFPAGTPIVTSTISGHRDVSYTTCPGDTGYSLLAAWRADVHRLVAATWARDGLQRAQRLDLTAP